jgi:hypothetical protein
MASAREFIELEWETWGGQLAMTVPPSVGRALKTQYPNRVCVVEVPDFTEQELREYCRRRERQWGTIPPDIRPTLRRPLLAKMYCDLATELTWSPVYEYEVFERYWQRITSTRNQDDAPETGVRCIV